MYDLTTSYCPMLEAVWRSRGIGSNTSLTFQFHPFQTDKLRSSSSFSEDSSDASYWLSASCAILWHCNQAITDILNWIQYFFCPLNTKVRQKCSEKSWQIPSITHVLINFKIINTDISIKNLILARWRFLWMLFGPIFRSAV